MFINLSNHPSDRWGTEQYKEAHKYGYIVDIAFPQVAFDATSDDIDELVQEKHKEIFGFLMDHENEENVLMVEGEFVFTFRMVTRFKAEGMTVVAAVTQRISSEERQQDGSIRKISRFKFEGFRKY